MKIKIYGRVPREFFKKFIEKFLNTDWREFFKDLCFFSIAVQNHAVIPGGAFGGVGEFLASILGEIPGEMLNKLLDAFSETPLKKVLEAIFKKLYMKRILKKFHDYVVRKIQYELSEEFRKKPPKKLLDVLFFKIDSKELLKMFSKKTQEEVLIVNC